VEAGAPRRTWRSSWKRHAPGHAQQRDFPPERGDQGLGAVNLAALEEHKTSGDERKDTSIASRDLNEAMTTLEDAIRRIDRRKPASALQHTFDEVNRHFSEMFPALRRGNAKLVLTGEEILDAGILVQAQPPGKKNTPFTCCREARRRSRRCRWCFRCSSSIPRRSACSTR